MCRLVGSYCYAEWWETAMRWALCLIPLACGSTPETELFDSLEASHSTGGYSDITYSPASGGASSLTTGGRITETGGSSIDCSAGAKPPPQGQPWSPNCKVDSDCAEMCQSRTALCLGWCECIGTNKTPCNTEYPHLTNQCYVGCPMHSECRDGKDCVPP